MNSRTTSGPHALHCMPDWFVDIESSNIANTFKLLSIDILSILSALYNLFLLSF